MHHSNFLTSFKYAFAGLWYVFRTQRNARIHLLVATIIVAVGLWLGLNRTEWAIIALTIGMVLAAEAFNTVAEAVVDLAAAEYHPLAKVAKDVAAGAVVLMVIAAVVVGALILGPPLWRVLFALF
ncbi:MAG: diacylglycerol kinase family protein [Anaerolineae bacterium]|jgi:diacylglycerol kinase (ATP)